MSQIFDKTLTEQNYALLKRTLKEVSGLYLTDNKMYLVETRLQAVAKDYGYTSLNELIDGLKGPRLQKLKVDISEAMATPETFFFRDKTPFDLFRTFILPHVAEHNKAKRSLSIWCAASSSGQEPYSLAMIVDDVKDVLFPGWDIKILASDFSEKILTKARNGIYSQFEVQRGLPIQYLMKHFTQKPDGWHVKDSLKRYIEFRNFNLLQNSSHLGRFDVVFCRNVLFYFERPDKEKILNNISSIMNDGAMMFLGAAETTVGISTSFSSLPNQKGIFVKEKDKEKFLKSA